MLRMIVRSVVSGENASLPDQYNTFDVKSPELEQFLRHNRLLDLSIGFELREDPPAKVEEKKPEPGSLADRLAKMKAAKEGNGKGNGEDKSKFAKWEQKAKERAAQEKKRKEAENAKGYGSRKRRGWFWNGGATK